MTNVLVMICLLLVSGCATALSSAQNGPEPGQPVAAAPQVVEGQYWIYQRGNGATVKKQELLFADELQFPLWVGKTWDFEQWRSPKLMTVDMRAEVVSYSPVTVPAGTFDAYEIRYECSSRGPFRQTTCGSWTRWYAPRVGNIIATKTYSAQSTWQLIKFRRFARH